MPEAHVWPEDILIDLDDQATVLTGALASGVEVAHLCGGRARCSTCRIRVVEGLDSLSVRTAAEQRIARKLDFPAEVRLACQTHVSGPIGFWRLVLDDEDIAMASQLGKGHYVGPVGRELEGVAVMFVDVAGFTAMSESLPAYDVVHILNRFFKRAGTAVEFRNGRVDNYMGDGMLAVFGVDDDADAALAAVETALDLIAIAAEMNTYVSRIYGHDFRVRAGIALGDVVYGLMGAESSARETVLGDVVNTASRIESSNKTTGTSLLVSDDVRTKTMGRVSYGRQFDLDLAGKDGHVVVHEVLGLVDELPG
jgi:adenylate cyclase